MSHVFISYSTRNADYANNLAGKLTEKGFDVWIDNRKLRVSQKWWEAIVKAIWTADALIVIMTPDSAQSEWVQKEVLLAINWKKPIFPLLLAGEEMDWTILLNRQFYDRRNNSLPGEDFFDSLKEVTALNTMQGNVVTKADTPMSVEDKVAVEKVIEEEDAPEPEPDVEDEIEDIVTETPVNLSEPQQEIERHKGKKSKSDADNKSVRTGLSLLVVVLILFSIIFLINQFLPPPDTNITDTPTGTELSESTSEATVELSEEPDPEVTEEILVTMATPDTPLPAENPEIIGFVEITSARGRTRTSPEVINSPENVLWFDYELTPQPNSGNIFRETGSTYALQGMSFPILSVSDDGNWFEVLLPDTQSAWIAGSQLNVVSETRLFDIRGYSLNDDMLVIAIIAEEELPVHVFTSMDFLKDNVDPEWRTQRIIDWYSNTPPFTLRTGDCFVFMVGDTPASDDSQIATERANGAAQHPGCTGLVRWMRTDQLSPFWEDGSEITIEVLGALSMTCIISEDETCIVAFD